MFDETGQCTTCPSSTNAGFSNLRSVRKRKIEGIVLTKSQRNSCGLESGMNRTLKKALGRFYWALDCLLSPWLVGLVRSLVKGCHGW